MTTYTTRTVNLKNAYGKHIRKTTVVRADWGTNFAEMTLLELTPKKQAIELAKREFVRLNIISPFNA